MTAVPTGMPLVSVLLASRDGTRFLDAALESLAAQTWPAVEFLLVDDGSRDDTRAKLEAFAGGHGRARVLSTPGIGLAGALALAASEAHGEFLARQDDDDVSAPGRLERQVRHLMEHPGIGVVGTAAEIVDERGVRIGDYPVPVESAAIARTLRRAPPFVHGSVVMRAGTYARAGGYRAPFRASQDFDLWLRLPAGTGLANLPEPLYRWRAHAGGAFARRRDEQLRFSALARVFAEERRERGEDSIDAFPKDTSWDDFLASYPRADRFRLILGEILVREGRVAEARATLGRAFAHPRSAGAAGAWWLASWPVGLLPRARRHVAPPREAAS